MCLDLYSLEYIALLATPFSLAAYVICLVTFLIAFGTRLLYTCFVKLYPKKLLYASSALN